MLAPVAVNVADCPEQIIELLVDVVTGEIPAL